MNTIYRAIKGQPKAGVDILQKLAQFHVKSELMIRYKRRCNARKITGFSADRQFITSTKFGVLYLTSTMTLKPHISNIVRVSSFHIRNISRIRKYLNQSAAEQIIHAFVTSRLDNGNALFYGLPQNQISRLQHIQNTAARVVTLSRKSCHITPMLKELHWLPVSQRIVFKLMLIVHKSVNNIAPIYISELLKVYTPSRNLRSSNMSLLKEPTSKRTWVDRSFSVAAPRLWNHLPTKLNLVIV